MNAAHVLEPRDLTGAVASLFRLRGPEHRLGTDGVRARLPAGPAATLGERVAAFFDTRRDGPQLLVGALPFDPHRDDALFQPEQLSLPGAGTLPASLGNLHASASSPPPVRNVCTQRATASA